MFKRLDYEEWQMLAPVIGFFITFSVFIYLTVRAIRMKRETADRLARLPLERDGTGPHPSAGRDQKVVGPKS